MKRVEASTFQNISTRAVYRFDSQSSRLLFCSFCYYFFAQSIDKSIRFLLNCFVKSLVAILSIRLLESMFIIIVIIC